MIGFLISFILWVIIWAMIVWAVVDLDEDVERTDRRVQ